MFPGRVSNVEFLVFRRRRTTEPALELPNANRRWYRDLSNYLDLNLRVTLCASSLVVANSPKSAVSFARSLSSNLYFEQKSEMHQTFVTTTGSAEIESMCCISVLPPRRLAKQTLAGNNLSRCSGQFSNAGRALGREAIVHSLCAGVGIWQALHIARDFQVGHQDFLSSSAGSTPKTVAKRSSTSIVGL